MIEQNQTMLLYELPRTHAQNYARLLKVDQGSVRFYKVLQCSATHRILQDNLMQCTGVLRTPFLIFSLNIQSKSIFLYLLQKRRKIFSIETCTRYCHQIHQIWGCFNKINEYVSGTINVNVFVYLYMNSDDELVIHNIYVHIAFILYFHSLPIVYRSRS